MSSARGANMPIQFNVTAFVLAHGEVLPTKYVTHTSSGPVQDCYQYQLTDEPLPKNTRLYAPQILGKSYYDRKNTDSFIYAIIRDWNKDYDALNDEHGSFINYCLSEIDRFEKHHVRLMEKKLEDEYRSMSESTDQLRHDLIEANMHKQDIRWNRHQCSIAEKLYYIDPRDTPPNCIMFFCEGGLSSYPIDVSKFSKSSIQIPISKYRSIYVYVNYDESSSAFKITVDEARHHEDDGVEVNFGDINGIVRTVLQMLLQGIPMRVRVNLDILDFTCDDVKFKGDECLRGLVPKLLSSAKLSHDHMGPNLKYGTTRKHIEPEHSELGRRLPDSGMESYDEPDNGAVSLERLHGLSVSSDAVSEFDGDSVSRSQSIERPSESPGVPPGPSLTVHLIGKVISFGDFGPSVFERSVSPARPGPAGRGGGRSRVIKKVSRKRITRGRRNGRFHAKGSSRRTRRKQK